MFQLSSTMAALWLHSVSLLVLLIVSLPASSQAMAPPQHLCGAQLVDTLYQVCSEKGFFYTPKRDVDPLLGENMTSLNTEPFHKPELRALTFICLSGFLPPKSGGAAAGGENEVAEFAFKDQMEMMVKRGIVEQCCHKPCNIFDLQNYCN